jgi:hypothetical protein
MTSAMKRRLSLSKLLRETYARERETVLQTNGGGVYGGRATCLANLPRRTANGFGRNRRWWVYLDSFGPHEICWLIVSIFAHQLF